MRRFTDADGARWTVALMQASYGEQALVFTPTGSSAVYACPLEAETAAGGHDFLAGLSDAELRERLAGARPWGGDPA